MFTLHEDLYTFKTITGSIFLGMRIVADKIVGKIKTHISCSTTFFPRKSGRLWDKLEKYCRIRQTTDDNTSTIRRL